MKLLIAAASFLICISATAQTVCDRLSENIESNLKEMSFQSMSGLFDNSAPRETNRQLKMVASLNAIQLAITQQQAAKCKPFVEPVTGSEYANSAAKCSSASREDVKQMCDRANWKRN